MNPIKGHPHNADTPQGEAECYNGIMATPPSAVLHVIYIQA